jgi:hypothetical protein
MGSSARVCGLAASVGAGLALAQAVISRLFYGAGADGDELFDAVFLSIMATGAVIVGWFVYVVVRSNRSALAVGSSALIGVVWLLLFPPLLSATT